MSHIVVVTGSVRPNSVNQKVVPIVVEEVEKQGATVAVADLAEIDLPFFNAPKSPNDPEFKVTDERAQKWTDMVEGADAVVFVAPEYNHSLSAVQLNAIDWIGKQWNNKPIGLVGYGWNGGKEALAAARNALSRELAAKVSDVETTLFFTRDLSPAGELIEDEGSRSAIAKTIASVIA
jgi:NAD(P)H-dependent FMN reductase